MADGQESLEVLRESEKRYRTLAETLPQLVWTCLPDGTVDYTNRNWTDYTGLSPDKLHGTGWRDTLHEEDREAAQARCAEALRGNVPYDLQYRLRGADGSYRWFQARALPLKDEEGRVTKWFGTCTDIDEHKRAYALIDESERWLRLIFENVKDFAVLSTDLAGRITAWNPGAERVFGYAAREVMGHSSHLIFTPEDRAARAPERELETARTTGSSLDERWHMRKDGSRFFASGTMRLMREEDGTPVGYTKVVRDITERKNAEDALRRAHLELEGKVSERTRELSETVQELEAFSYSVSHDMRAPLRAMRGYADLLRADFADAMPLEARRYLERIILGADRLQRLVHDVLTYSKIGRTELATEPIDLDTLVSDILEEEEAFKPPRALVTVKPPLGRVVGHVPSLIQCLTNLFSNAIKFVPEACTPQISISSERADGQVRLSVADNGIGIHPRDQERIFNLFERVNPDGAFTGTGVGLSILKRAVERMNGRVGVESDLGKGSRFWIELPEA